MSQEKLLYLERQHRLRNDDGSELMLHNSNFVLHNSCQVNFQFGRTFCVCWKIWKFSNINDKSTQQPNILWQTHLFFILHIHADEGCWKIYVAQRVFCCCLHIFLPPKNLQFSFFMQAIFLSSNFVVHKSQSRQREKKGREGIERRNILFQSWQMKASRFIAAKRIKRKNNNHKRLYFLLLKSALHCTASVHECSEVNLFSSHELNQLHLNIIKNSILGKDGNISSALT